MSLMRGSASNRCTGRPWRASASAVMKPTEAAAGDENGTLQGCHGYLLGYCCLRPAVVTTSDHSFRSAATSSANSAGVMA